MFLVEETDKRFYLKKSTIKNGGIGVFAREAIKAGDYLEIIGVFVEINSISDHCTNFAMNYKFAGKREKYNRHIVPMGFGGMVNHADEGTQNAILDYHTGLKRNTAASSCIYRFIRDIEPDEEILGNYGERWEAMLKWAEQSSATADDCSSEIETFLSHGLYNLDLLKRFKE